MEDITPGLLKKITEEFDSLFNKSELINKLYAKVRDGTATYQDANDIAIEVGQILGKAYKDNLSSAVLPDGRMYYNIANRVIPPTMTNNYELITDVTDHVQKSLNEAADIGLKAITPEINQDRIKGIVDRVSEAVDFDDIAWILEEPVVNFSQSIVDDAIRVNAEFHAKAGLQPVITRKVAGNCCDWCKALAGKYRYPYDVPADVYRRHQRCRCTVNYDPKDGKIQNVHSKIWRSAEESDKIEVRKTVGLDHLTGTDKAALNQYKSFESYLLNEALREGYDLSEAQKIMMNNIDKALEKLPTFEGVTYRSLDSERIRDLDAFWEKYQVGSVVSEKAYTSTSISVYDESFDIQMIVKGRSGRDLRAYTDFENKIVYPRKVKFMVTKREGTTIWLKEI